MSQNWYVVSTHPAREAYARLHLDNQGFETFLPMRKKTLRIKKRLRTVLAPLFPGYLFVHVEMERRLIRSINGSRGVKFLLSSGEIPSPLPAGFVEALMINSNADGTVSYRPDLKAGDRVELAAGPFARKMGQLLQLDDRGRVAVLLELLSTRVRVATDISNLLPA